MTSNHFVVCSKIEVVNLLTQLRHLTEEVSTQRALKYLHVIEQPVLIADMVLDHHPLGLADPQTHSLFVQAFHQVDPLFVLVIVHLNN